MKTKILSLASPASSWQKLLTVKKWSNKQITGNYKTARGSTETGNGILHGVLVLTPYRGSYKLVMK